MQDSQQDRYSGTQYTTSVALLIVALAIIPGILVLSRPVGLAAIVLMLTSSTSIVVLAWFTWKNHSNLTISSIIRRNLRAE